VIIVVLPISQSTKYRQVRSPEGAVAMAAEIARERISQTFDVIRPHLRQTPTITVAGNDFGLNTERIIFKLELLQHSGSFKVRGAFANLLLRKIPKAGVVAASGGNHGVAVAYAAMKLDKPAKIFVPEICSPAKVERIRDYKADLVVGGALYADALAASEKWVAESRGVAIHAFDQTETLLGAGSLGLELDQQAPELDTVLAPVGGGGLIGGVAAAFDGKVKVVGVEPEASPTLFKAFKAGKPVDAPAGGIAADSLGPRRVGELMFPIAKRFIDYVVLVSEDEIRQAQRVLWSVLRVVAEPGGATATAALLSGRYQPKPNERVAVMISGGNTTAVDFDR
jgi:threonine dehydratase